MRRDDSTDAPADSVRWASNLFRTRAAESERSLLKKVAAILQMEISPKNAAFGERSASASQARQLLFQAEENAIDLRIEPSQSGFSIRGQILGEGFASAWVKLFNDSNVFAIRATEMSEFAFNDVPPGRYELSILGEKAEISLKTIDIE